MERKLIAAAVSSALALPMAAQAIEFSVSGHVNRALVLEDQDGNPNDGKLQNKDSNASASRFRFTGSEDLGNGLTAGVQMELAVHSDDSGTTTAGTGTRHANVYLSTPGGKITLGKGSSATDGMTNARLGGPSWLGGVTNWCAYATPSYKVPNPAAPLDEDKRLTVAAAACQTHDPGRQQVLRYDSPALGPATISASMGNKDYKDIEVTFSGSVGDSAYDLRVGYVGEDDNNDDDIVGASGAVKFAMGTAIAIGWANTKRDVWAGTSRDDDESNSYTHFEIDHSYGDGSVGAYYKTGESNGVDGSLWGIGVGHNIGGGATVYAGYRHVEDDDPNIEDHNLFVTGMRVTFK